MTDTDADVVVVGGGLSGLAAADLLTRAGLGVTVLEARDRPGGRLLTVELGGALFDVGGQWIGPDQTRMHALADGLGMATFPTATEGRSVLDVAGRRSTSPGTIPRLPLLGLLQLHRTMRAVDRAAAGTAPAGTVDADADRRTLADWLHQRGLRADVRGVVTAAMRVVFGREPEEVSLLQVLRYVRSAGSLEALVETAGGAQETRFVDGAGTLATSLAERVGVVRTGSPVTAVSQDDDAVTVTHAGGGVRAGAAVVAVPPHLAAEIDFEPPLPAVRRTLLADTVMGTTVKCLAVYDRPFWRDDGLSGEAVATTGPLSVVFDNTSADGTACLVGFSVAGPGRRLRGLDAERRREAVLLQLGDLLGAPARHPRAYLEHDWDAERWTGGCPVALPGVGVAADADADPREPYGRVHWAGTELASEWRGYMEGAVQSGQRAAREIIAAMEGRS